MGLTNLVRAKISTRISLKFTLWQRNLISVVPCAALAIATGCQQGEIESAPIATDLEHHRIYMDVFDNKVPGQLEFSVSFRPIEDDKLGFPKRLQEQDTVSVENETASYSLDDSTNQNGVYKVELSNPALGEYHIYLNTSGVKYPLAIVQHKARISDINITSAEISYGQRAYSVDWVWTNEYGNPITMPALYTYLIVKKIACYNSDGTVDMSPSPSLIYSNAALGEFRITSTSIARSFPESALATRCTVKGHVSGNWWTRREEPVDAPVSIDILAPDLFNSNRDELDDWGMFHFQSDTVVFDVPVVPEPQQP